MRASARWRTVGGVYSLLACLATGRSLGVEEGLEGRTSCRGETNRTTQSSNTSTSFCIRALAAAGSAH